MPARSGGFTPVNSVDVTPPTRLELEPAIESVTDVDAALAERAYLKSLAETAHSSFGEQLRLLEAARDAKLVTVIEGQQLTIAERDNVLEAAMQRAFAEQPGVKEELFPEGKTSERPHGTLKYRTTNKLTEREGENATSILERIEAKTKIIASIRGLLARRKLWKRPLERYVRVKRELNKQAINEDWRNEQLTDRNAKALGFEPRREVDELTIEVGPWTPPAR